MKKITIAGPGCPKCHATEKAVKKACGELGLDAEITHAYDIKEYSKLGVMLTPAVLVDGKIVLSGRTPSVEDAKKLLA